MKEPVYKIGDRVYHSTPDSEQGVVIDVCYYFLSKQYQYQVAFSPVVASLWYYEHELQTNKTFI